MFENVDVQVITTGVVGLITTIVSGWTSWLFAKKKYNAEVDSNVIENMHKSLEFYKQLSDDNKNRLDQVLSKNEALEKEVAELRLQLFELMNSICYNMSCKLREISRESEMKANKQAEKKPSKSKKNEA